MKRKQYIKSSRLLQKCLFVYVFYLKNFILFPLQFLYLKYICNNFVEFKLSMKYNKLIWRNVSALIISVWWRNKRSECLETKNDVTRKQNICKKSSRNNISFFVRSVLYLKFVYYISFPLKLCYHFEKLCLYIICYVHRVFF